MALFPLFQKEDFQRKDCIQRKRALFMLNQTMGLKQERTRHI